MTGRFFISMVLALACAACTVAGERSLLTQKQTVEGACAVPVTKTEIDYAADVLPLFQAKGCTGCHPTTAGVSISDLPDVISVGERTGGPVIIPCEPEASTLYMKISSACDPPFGSKMPLRTADHFTAEESSIIQQWIAEGANATFDPTTCAETP